MSEVFPEETPLDDLVKEAPFIVVGEAADPPRASVKVLRQTMDPYDAPTLRYVVREVLNTPDGPIPKPENMRYPSWLKEHPDWDKGEYRRLTRTPPVVGDSIDLLPDDLEDMMAPEPEDEEFSESPIIPTYTSRGPADASSRALFIDRHYSGHWNGIVWTAFETDVDAVRDAIARLSGARNR